CADARSGRCCRARVAASATRKPAPRPASARPELQTMPSPVFLGFDLRNLARTLAQDGDKCPGADEHECPRPEPQQPSAGLDGRIVKYEIVVARNQICLDFGIALAFAHQVEDLLAQI